MKPLAWIGTGALLALAGIIVLLAAPLLVELTVDVRPWAILGASSGAVGTLALVWGILSTPGSGE